MHYQIQKQENGMVGINEGPKFPGPVELVTHHKVSTINWMIGLKTCLNLALKLKTVDQCMCSQSLQ